jgi:hypothetical protein
MFVDHDKRRLAGLVSDTWQVRDGRVTVVQGGSGAGDGTGQGSAAVIQLIRYQAGLLLRSHRWLGPLLLYAVCLVSATGGGSGGGLRDGLDWSAAMLVPAVGWLTRSALTAEPDAARACTAAAGGPYKAHLAALVTALAGGIVLALAGAGYELATCQLPAAGGPGLASVTGAGLATAVVCVGVGSAAGALCNPPVVRRLAVSVLSTTAAVILALVAGISPAHAALRHAGSGPHPAASLAVLPLVAGIVLAALAWTVSTLLAPRRGA